MTWVRYSLDAGAPLLVVGVLLLAWRLWGPRDAWRPGMGLATLHALLLLPVAATGVRAFAGLCALGDGGDSETIARCKHDLAQAPLIGWGYAGALAVLLFASLVTGWLGGRDARFTMLVIVYVFAVVPAFPIALIGGLR
jgi:hypothetical protein